MDRRVKLVVFGTGQYYENRKRSFEGDDIEIVAFLDNDKKKWGLLLDGVKIVSPKKIDSIEYEYILIATLEIKIVTDQLLSLGISKDRILTYQDYMVEFRCAHRAFESNKSNREKVLIAYPLLIKGGAMEAALNLAGVISELGYEVTIATECTTDVVKEKLLSSSINVIETTKIYNYKKIEGDWTSIYRAIIACSIDMLQFAIEVGEATHAVLWLHDPAKRIRQISDTFFQKYSAKCIDKINVYAVSDNAKRGFNRVFPNKEVRILPYGLHDVKQNSVYTSKLIFALIGGPYYIKGYDIYLEVISEIPDDKKFNTEFWIVGVDENTKRIPDFLEKTNGLKGLVCKEWMEKRELDSLYSKINVLVSASREDMLPTVLVEGAMNNITCITSDATGIAPYIKDGINGFVFKNESREELKEKILWCICNRDKLYDMGKRTREIYDNYFSWTVFKDNVNDMMNEVEI